MDLRRFALRAALALGVIGLSGCALTDVQPLQYRLVSVKTERDPKTGNWVKIALWRYADGTYTSTTEIFIPGTTKAGRQEAELDPPRARFAG